MESSSNYNSSNSTSVSGGSIQSTYEVEEVEHTPVEWISLLFVLVLLGIVVALILLSIRLEENNTLFTLLNENLESKWSSTPITN